jgi:tetratricopeptide (TPR) repeat protein
MTATFPQVTIDSPNELYNKGYQCLKVLDCFQAIAFFNQCLRIQPGHVNALVGLAVAQQKINWLQPALTAFRQALKFSPDNPEILLGIGTCYLNDGDFAKAATFYERALKVDPDNAKVMYNLATLDKHGPNARIIGELRRLYDSPSCTVPTRALVCFALAKIYESHGEIHLAFRYYTEGNAAQFSLTGYDERRYADMFSEIQATFAKQLFDSLGNTGRMDAAPIFVLGMPRSGTSLVEQILASHSQIYGAGEMFAMPWIAERLIPQTTRMPFPYGTVACLSAPMIKSLADVYLQ